MSEGPTYTVKEMLAVMAKQADERHVETKVALTALSTKVDLLIRDRIEPLERDVSRRGGVSEARRAMWVVGLGVYGIVCNLPALLVNLHK